MWSQTTAQGTATSSGVVSLLTVLFLAVGSRGSGAQNNCVGRFGSGRLPAEGCGQVLGDADGGTMTSSPEENHPGSVVAPWKGRGWATAGASGGRTCGWDWVRSGAEPQECYPVMKPTLSWGGDAESRRAPGQVGKAQ